MTLNDVFEEYRKKGNDKEKEKYVSDIRKIYSVPALVGAVSKEETNLCLAFAKAFIGKRTQNENIETIGTYYYRMYNGGTERVVSLLVNIWVELGYNVVLFTDEEENILDYEIPQSVKRITLKNGCKKTTKQNYYLRAEEFGKQLIDNNIDIMVYHAWQEPLLLWELMLIKGYNIPFILYTHGVFATIYHVREIYTDIVNDVYKLCDKIICLTEVSYEYYKMLGCSVNYVQNPIDKKLYYAKQAKLDNHNILWIGRISGEKRPEDALDIFQKIVSEVPDAELYIVGEGDRNLEKKMKREIQEKGYSGKIHMCGYQEQVGAFYENAAVMLLTSEFEGYCLTLLESKAYGVPCAMYKLPYLSLSQNKKGICDSEIGDIEGISKNIINLLLDLDFRRKKGKEARESFEIIANYDQKNCWNNILNEIEEGKQVDNCNKEKMMMLNLLIEHNNIGIKQSISKYKDSLEYKIGYKLMYFPRKVWNYLWRITHQKI